MKIPAYWSKATAEDTDRNGSPQAFTCWRSSDQSPEHARESALAAAKRILQNLLAGKRPDHRYGYGDAPLREEVVERFTDDDGALYAAVTRNGYGSLVLNASQAMFIDLDFPATPPGELIGGFFARLFGKSGPSPEQKKEDAVRSRLERFLGEHPGWGFRVYRTCAGIRALATHDVFDPAADATLDVFRVLGTDPLYVRLCKAQACFRARLTPKPWRCSHYPNPVRWPREDGEQGRFEQWLAEYKTAQSRYATCRFLGVIGRDAIHPAMETIVEVHDTVTRCRQELELA